MRIDLPMCNFKNCKYSFDSNCTKKSEYERCEYRQQKAEIENLKAENLELKNGYFQKRYEETEHQELIGLRKAWQKSRMDYIDLNAKWEGKFKTAKTEAIKELEEKLKSHKRRMCGNDNGGLYWDQAVLVDDIDRVMKEMTEEQE